MNETITLTLSVLAGGLIGLFFFGGLWWTIRKGTASDQPALWFLGSLLLRMSVALIGIFLVGGGQWHRMVSCLFGFLAARLLVTWFINSRSGGHHATHA